MTPTERRTYEAQRKAAQRAKARGGMVHLSAWVPERHIAAIRAFIAKITKGEEHE